MEEDMDQQPENVDLDLAVESGIALLFSEEGRQRLLEAINQNDPVTVAAKAVVGVLAQVRSKFQNEQMPLDDAVFFGDEGAAAQLLVHIFKLFEKEAGIEVGQAEYEAAMDIMSEDAARIMQTEQQATQAPMGQAPMNQAPAQGVAGRLQQQGGVM